MRIGVVHTVGSPCRCAESVSAGLRALNHEILLADSGEIEFQAAELARTCDLVIDHTDTFHGRGLYRPMVRLLLENYGARVVGSAAQACFIADNKPAAKKRLAEAGIPVPPGIVIYSNSWELPRWLRPPLVLKPAFEHMSRGVCIVRTEQEARAEAARLLDSLRQPLVVESYIPGRELAVSILGGPSLEVLPVLEWGMGQAGTDILTEDFKLLDPLDEKHSTLRADLAADLKRELEDLARRAFHALDLRDYGRFDLRLSPGGSLFFLEANTTPSLEPLEALAISAEWAGLDYAQLVDRLLSAARGRYESLQMRQQRLIQVRIPAGLIEVEIPEGVHSPPESTIELAGLLDLRPGENGLELGCGSGLLSIAMAKLGARRVVATDLFPEALAAIEQNARLNSVEGRIEIRAGSWYDALPHTRERYDVIIATPPQTPGRQPFGPKYGGPDGTTHLFRIIDAAQDFLNRESGRMWLMTVSLANPQKVWERLQEQFSEVVLVRETERRFTAAEYEALQEGLFDYLLLLRSSGVSDFIEIGNGGYSFRNRIIRAAKPRSLSEYRKL